MPTPAELTGGSHVGLVTPEQIRRKRQGLGKPAAAVLKNASR